MHVKVQMSEDKGGTILTAIEDYRVMGMYTKTYNKWYVSEMRRESLNKGMAKCKVHVYTRMIMFDHSMGKYKDVKPEESVKWGKKSVFVLCDAGDIIDVVQKLSAT